MTSSSSRLAPLTLQQLALISEVAEAYAMAFPIGEPAKREPFIGLLITLVERGIETKAELALALEQEIAKGFFERPALVVD